MMQTQKEMKQIKQKNIANEKRCNQKLIRSRKRETRHIHSTREANLWSEEQDGMLSLMSFLASVFYIIKEE